MEFCFTNRASSICYVSAAAVRRPVHVDPDILNKGQGRFGRAIDGLRLILPSKAQFLLRAYPNTFAAIGTRRAF